jgi:succinoglycan biosynthesis protein ExoU
VTTGSVCVVIAARNAERTIGLAVRSSLNQSDVVEVVVVDDASTDATASMARQASRGDSRLRVLRQDINIGPAAARNLAIANSEAPIISIVDADDYVLDGRYTHLLSRSDWDITADNIVFVSDNTPDTGQQPCVPSVVDGREVLDLASFVLGNIPHQRMNRGELGFLKPLIRREFLTAHQIAYDPGLRLGEDYDLYVQSLQNGARFLLSRNVGYAARVRADSLSSCHSAADLQALLLASKRHVDDSAGQSLARVAMLAHQRNLRDRFLLRAFLERKADASLTAALRFAFRPPANFQPIARGVLRDKMAALKGGSVDSPVGRYLLPLIAEP